MIVPNAEHVESRIPINERISTPKMIYIWGSYPFNTGTAITGGVIALESSLKTMIYGVLIGNIILMIYVGLLGQIGCKTGLTFVQLAKNYFGKYLSVIVSSIMVLTVFGWFNMNTAFPAELISQITGLNYTLVDFLLVIIFGAVVYAGINGVEIISILSIPMYATVLLAAYFIILYNGHFSAVVMPIGNHKLTIIQVTALAIASYTDSGTLAPDYNRWAKTVKASWLSVISAFPFANSFSLITGAIFVSLYYHLYGASSPFHAANPAVYLAKISIVGMCMALLVVGINGGNGAVHALYNSALGASNILRLRFKKVVILMTLISVGLSSIDLWSYILQWLSLLGLLIAPIGSALICVYFLKITSHRFIKYGVGLPILRIAAFVGMTTGWSVSIFAKIFGYTDIFPMPAVVMIFTGISTTITALILHKVVLS